MKNQANKKPELKMGDLIDLGKLVKPAVGGFKIEVGGEGEKARQLSDTMSDLAQNIEDNQGFTAKEVSGLVDALKDSLKKELSLERSVQLLQILKKRFLGKNKPYKSAEGINWDDVQSRLEKCPEKLWSLNEMERTGGEPDIFGIDENTGEYIFMDFSLESPTGRRNCVYDKEGEAILKRDYPVETCDGHAVGMAAMMGITLLNEEEYRALQTKGDFDKNTWSWLKT